MLKTEVLELTKSQQFVSTKYDHLFQNYQDLLASCKQREDEIKQLRKNATSTEIKIEEDKQKIDDIDQYNRRQNLIFEGVPTMETENVNDIVIRLVKKFDVSIQDSDISIAHKLPIKKSHPFLVKNNSAVEKHPPIIVRFVKRTLRNEIYSKRQQSRSFSDFPVAKMKHQFINENLTQVRKRLFWLAKQAARELHYKCIWTNNGNIFVRKGDDSNKIHIRGESCLDNLWTLLKAATSYT